ncbi:hypothetical protein ACT6NV_03455 [Robiginitalea sp. IMCC44478]|uniref:hypothetical protein n=1 Tax=Robiginitalea sp. IMCC44478 TaxID=3459122 RepID=UPI0040416CD0
MSINSKRIISWVVFILAVLSIPLLAMQFSEEVQWSPVDFMIIGGALAFIAFAYEFISRKSKHRLFRIACALSLVSAFLLFWVNAAVGIIGAENQDVNLLFAGVLLIGLSGAAISGLKPLGMRNTLYVMAAAQMLIPVIGLMIWPPSEISWSPGILGVFVFSGFFALLFAVSGRLFHKVAKDIAGVDSAIV